MKALGFAVGIMAGLGVAVVALAAALMALTPLEEYPQGGPAGPVGPGDADSALFGWE